MHKVHLDFKGKLYISIVIGVILLNVLAWNSTVFCDAYIAYVFPVWVNTMGRISGLFPFSVGEWMIIAGVVSVVLFVLAGVCCLVSKVVIVSRIRKQKQTEIEGQTWNEMNGGHKINVGNKMSKWARCYCRGFAWLFLIVCMVMTLNCFILYHASTFSEKYFGKDTAQYMLTDLIRVHNLVASECNRLCEVMERDAEGRVVYLPKDGNAEYVGAGTEEAMSDEEQRKIMADTARRSMRQLGQAYDQLDGWYPRPKAMTFSDFMCQQYMCGYYFPFSMEANYNDVMFDLNKPSTMCHELAHLRGYIFEDEANFIGYLACVESEDSFFQYSGYLSVLVYLQNDLFYALQADEAAFRAAVEEVPLVPVTEQVYLDDIFVEQSEWDRINGEALLDTETVDEISDTFTDTTLKMNGVSDGMVSYSRVVRLLLQYYAQKGLFTG